LQLQTILIVTISAISILCMLLRPRGIPEVYWACGGAFVLIVTRLLPLPEAGYAVFQGIDVYLFLIGMMILAELAREKGVFEWVADVAAHHARGSSSRLFLLVYGAGALVTALLSNDATAVVLTPAVLTVVRKAKVDPKPYLLACALIANAASFILPISNPANLVIFGSNMPHLMHWLRMFLIPSLASVLITFLVLRIMSHSKLKDKPEDIGQKNTLSADGKLTLASLTVACLVLISASALGLSLGAPTCVAAMMALFVIARLDRQVHLQVAKGVSWSVVPLVAGLFAIVQALERTGILHAAANALRVMSHAPAAAGKLVTAFVVALFANGMNNLPVGLMSGAAIQAAQQSGNIANSVLIGVDLGPNLSVTGSLATILWLIALRRENTEISGWQFLKVGAIAMPLALLGSVTALGR
jgi:arsenical pump membrane protein